MLSREEQSRAGPSQAEQDIYFTKTYTNYMVFTEDTVNSGLSQKQYSNGMNE